MEKSEMVFFGVDLAKPGSDITVEIKQMRCTALKPCGVKDCATCGVWKR